MASSRISTDLYVGGLLSMDSIIVPDGSISRAKLATNLLASYPIPLTSFRVWDAITTLLPATSATDDLGLYGGTWATSSPLIHVGLEGRRGDDAVCAGDVSATRRVL